MKRVTPSLAAKIRTQRARGETISAIAHKYGLSTSTVHAVVSKSEPRPAPDGGSPPAAPAPAGAPLEHEDLRRYLTEQIDALRADCARHRESGNESALHTATRNLNAATALLSRMTPTAPPQHEGTFVKTDDMRKLAEQGEGRLLTLVKGTFRERENWPMCPECGQKVAPKDVGT